MKFNMMKKKILYIDMDGVIADFDKRILDYCPDINDPVQYSNPLIRDFTIDKICSENETFYHDLPAIDGAVEAVKKLFPLFDIYFLSSPMWNVPHSFIGKRVWIEKHFGEMATKRLILTHRKDLNLGHFLVDDRIRNGVSNFKGLHIHFGTEKFSNWDKTYNYLITKSVTDGMTYMPNRNKIEFNFGDKLINPFFKIKEHPLEKIQIDDLEEIYYSGFEFEKSDSTSLQETFLNKFSGANLFTSEENKKTFIHDLLVSLNAKINLATFGILIFPNKKTVFCQELRKDITKFYRISMLTFEEIEESEALFQKIQKEDFAFANKEILILTDTKTLETDLIKTVKKVRAINTKSKIVIYSIAKKMEWN